MMEIGKMIKKKEKELKLIILKENSLKILYYYFVFRCLNGQMEIYMMENGKTISKKEKEL